MSKTHTWPVLKEDYPIKIYKQVKKFREKLGVSQSELSRMAGVSLATIVQIESGRNYNPRVLTLASIAHELDVSVDDLLDLR